MSTNDIQRAGKNFNNIVTEWGDLIETVVRYAQKLVEKKCAPPFTIVSTPNVLNEAMLHIRRTLNISEYDLIRDLRVEEIEQQHLVSDWIIDAALGKDVITLVDAVSSRYVTSGEDWELVTSMLPLSLEHGFKDYINPVYGERNIIDRLGVDE